MLALPVVGVTVFLVVGGLILLGVTSLVPRRSWPWLLLIGCSVLAPWPLALAALPE
ncbi:hypothetical protein QOL99_12305 [Deinococcus sp. MIMF12]|uniref:DUF4175 domain-containing protein n=1 Tax=Deinococcus rhizophilus TaxID=3049544 RepID=A0ABT7JK10_9DEIO|nr:hypothetical protein [Deinococcus rhizophilus]MDL2344927.1 hypothetical protein [Deinococcus rhizophilus]